MVKYNKYKNKILSYLKDVTRYSQGRLCIAILTLCMLLMPRIGLMQERIKVTTLHNPPFVFSEEGMYSGFMMELWDAIAQENDWKYDIKQVDSYVSLLRSARDNTADLAIADLSITLEREELMDFSSEIFDSGLQVMIPKKQQQDSFSKKILNNKKILVILAVLSAFFISIHGMWWGERGRKNIINRKYSTGIMDASWWTLTLGGFGKALPISPVGRFSLIIWMFAITMGLSLYVGAVSSTGLFHSSPQQVHTYHDLKGKKVGTTKGSFAEAELRRSNIDTILYKDSTTLFEDVALGLLDGAVHDVQLLRYFAANTGKNRVQIIGPVFNNDSYGIALPQGSALTQDINSALKKLRTDGTYDQLYTKWFKQL